MGKALICLLIVPVFLFFVPCLTSASDMTLEKDLQRNLYQSKAILEIVQDELRAGLPVEEE